MADRSKAKAEDLVARLRVDPGSKVRLSKLDPAATHGFDKDSAEKVGAKDLERLEALQEQVWAEHRHRILIVRSEEHTSELQSPC